MDNQNKEISLGTLYEMNKQVIQQTEKVLTKA